MAPTKQTASTGGKKARREQGRPNAAMFDQFNVDTLFASMQQAALDGDWYTLCINCKHGPLDPKCQVMTARIDGERNEWSKDGLTLVCCNVNQVLRNGVFTREEARKRLR